MISGDLPPGSWIRENDLAGRLGVSRTPIREAFRELVGVGVVEVVPRRGTRVRSYDAEEIEQIYRSRAVIEPYVMSESIGRLTADDFASLDILAEEMKRLASDPATRSQIASVNNDFHGIFIRRSAAQSLISTTFNLMIPIVVAKLFSSYSDSDVTSSMNHHDELIAAARAEDKEWAAAVSKTHIISGLNRFKAMIADTTSEGEPEP
ncbi:DNA-binding GntR family transcriptional regulator [Brevibacterium marinum]|uniref:DNA-binding GntR family transcriptional regulator n=1 Tax=Brevibacterium marinum TaxID=418643 RepID=A0A846RMQ3_9MICO|nr:DNA-binding GntR family transcriptional regulator [Brevibacterium marinum]